jgi:hypothetical protein
MYYPDPAVNGFFQIDGSKAYQNGLELISVEDTVLNISNFLIY